MRKSDRINVYGLQQHMSTTRKRFSKDPLVHLLPLKDFLEKHPDFFEMGPLRSGMLERPESDWGYYFYDATKIGFVYYGSKSINFGEDFEEKLKCIEVAYRDGTELTLLNEAIATAESELEKTPSKRGVKTRLNKLRKLKKAFARCKENRPLIKKRFEDYLIDTGLKFEWEYPGDYVVLDVETNGLRWTKDDLLSISIYSPKTGLCYNRFLPLDQQPLVLTGWINGIGTEDLEGEEHLTQSEFDRIMREFKLSEVTVLCYSGGDGSFDLNFLTNYCNRHGISGCEIIKIKNIKSLVPTPPYGTEGQATKDNLCRLFGIKGVSDIHTGLNDCILEWRLFDVLMTHKVFFVDNHLVEYTDGYVIPISYLTKHYSLARYAGIDLPPVYAEAEEVFSYNFPWELIERIRKFSTNITGITVENAIDFLVGAEKQDNREFLINNRKKLKYIGSFEQSIVKIPMIALDDGTVKTTDERFEAEIEIINSATKVVMEGLAGTVRFINENIICGEKPMSQEMVIAEEGKLLALCDISTNSAVLEIKTYDVLSPMTSNGKKHFKPEIAYQLYYQSKGRQCYVLSIKFGTAREAKEAGFYQKIDSLNIEIYKAHFFGPESVEARANRLSPYFKPYFQAIKESPTCGYKGFQKASGSSRTVVQRAVNVLRSLGFIEHVGSKFAGEWRILKEPSFWDEK